MAEAWIERFKAKGISIPVGNAEFKDRFDYIVARLKGKPLTKRLRAMFGTQTGGGGIPKNLAKQAKKELAPLFSPPPLTGGLSILPKEKPTLEGFLESQGIPRIPITTRKTPGDFLGNTARWWVGAASSPYLGAVVKLTFFVLFFLSFVESTPLVGSVLSVVLDVALASSRAFMKIFQKGLPTLVGLIPLPYTQFAGVALVSIVGMFVWPLIAAISFARQDFTSAIDSMLRVIPVPIGEALGDGFLEANRMVDQVVTKKDKFMDDLWNALQAVQGLVDTVGSAVGSVAGAALSRVQSGTSVLTNAVSDARQVETATPVPDTGQLAPVATPVAPGTIPTAAPVPEATPVAQEAPPVPTAPPVEAPEPAPVTPEPAPVTQEPAPVTQEAAPVTQEAAPVAQEAPPAPEPVPAAPTSALERLRSQKTAFTAPKQLQGGRRKTLSMKKRKQRKWTTRQTLYERFSGAGLR